MSHSELAQLMRTADQRQREGCLSEAAATYRNILQRDPRHRDALWQLGKICHQQGNLDEAAETLQRWIALNPGKAESHGILGDIFRAQGKFEEAIRQYNEVIRLKPALAAGYLNLGRALQGQGKLADAISAYEQAIKLRPDWSVAHECLGNALFERNQFEPAVAAFNQALRFQPDSCTAHWNLAKVFIAQGRHQEALACFQRAAQLNPSNPQAHFFLGCQLKNAMRFDEAAAELREAIRLKPDSPDWKFQLAAITGDGSAKTAPAAYLRNLFDAYAPTFENHLVEKLHYHVPDLLLEQVLSATPNRQLDILDLGCGTGLCGLKFRSIAKRLVGVDIAPRMIKTAKARNIYDELHTADVIEWLRSTMQRFDLILAGDLLIYIGDLTDFMPAASNVLHPGGLLACSLEDYAGTGFMLHSEERYCHSLTYFRESAHSSGLTEVSANKIVVRINKGVDVPGWTVLAIKS